MNDECIRPNMAAFNLRNLVIPLIWQELDSHGIKARRITPLNTRDSEYAWIEIEFKTVDDMNLYKVVAKDRYRQGELVDIKCIVNAQ